MKILSGEFNEKVGRLNIFKPAIGDDDLRKGIEYMISSGTLRMSIEVLLASFRYKFRIYN
jgi:hypothetical protein